MIISRKDYISITCLLFAASSQKRNNILNGLFSAHLKYSADVLESIEEFLKNSLSYLLDDPIEGEENNSVTYPSLTKANFYLFYKSAFVCLLQFLKRALYSFC